MAEEGHPNALKRALGAGDLIMLAIGAVIGAGIFGAIGTAAAGQTDAAGHVIRQRRGPGTGPLVPAARRACAPSPALCYAELAAMIPQAGSAYAYSYATLGEIVAWIIGWDLILEYAVGNVAVAISWGDYFKSLHRAVGCTLPVWLTTATARRCSAPTPAMHGLLAVRAARRGHPDPGQHPGVRHRRAHHVAAAARRAGERAREQHHGRRQAARARRCSSWSGAARTSTRRTTIRSRRTASRGIHQGAAIVFFAYIGFDAISTAAEETKNPQRNLPIGILGGLAICTRHLRDRRRGADRAWCRTGARPERARRSARVCAQRDGHARRRLDRRARRGVLDDGRVAGVPVRPAAHLLRDGARRPAAAVGGARCIQKTRSAVRRRRSSPASSSRSGR